MIAAHCTRLANDNMNVAVLGNVIRSQWLKYRAARVTMTGQDVDMHGIRGGRNHDLGVSSRNGRRILGQLLNS
jgi:hypothetical protein